MLGAYNPDCSRGIPPSVAEGQPVATINDHVTGLNIKSFPGQCSATHKQCVPETPTAWLGGESSAILSSFVPIIAQSAMLDCTTGGGKITIQDAGQSMLEVSPLGGMEGADNHDILDSILSGLSNTWDARHEILDYGSIIPDAGGLPAFLNQVDYIIDAAREQDQTKKEELVCKSNHAAAAAISDITVGRALKKAGVPIVEETIYNGIQVVVGTAGTHEDCED